jgi:hypothetical protein
LARRAVYNISAGFWNTRFEQPASSLQAWIVIASDAGRCSTSLAAALIGNLEPTICKLNRVCYSSCVLMQLHNIRTRLIWCMIMKGIRSPLASVAYALYTYSLATSLTKNSTKRRPIDPKTSHVHYFMALRTRTMHRDHPTQWLMARHDPVKRTVVPPGPCAKRLLTR